MAVRRLANDWAEHHGFRPVLAETFVDEAKFAGTSYKAANWELIGQTSGKGKLKTAKAVHVYALTPDFKSILLNGPTTPPAVKPRQPARTAALASDDPFVRLWANISATMVTVANAHDHVWQKRQRVLNTFIVMLFIFRLVFSSSRPGYTITLIELWDQCRVLGINMPQEIPVTAGGSLRGPGPRSMKLSSRPSIAKSWRRSRYRMPTGDGTGTVCSRLMDQS